MSSADTINKQVDVPGQSSSIPKLTNARFDMQSNQHHMVTRSKNGIFKPKVYMFELIQVKPKDIHEAVAIPSWKKAVDDELQALIRNETWDLMVAAADQNLVGCKWLFKNKTNPDGSIVRKQG